MRDVDRRRVILGCGVGLLPLLSACWRYSQTTVQEENESYLRLVGDLTGVSIALDGHGPQELRGSGGDVAEDSTLWKVLPGRHLVELHRGGEVILKRDIFVGRSQVIEIAVPR